MFDKNNNSQHIFILEGVDAVGKGGLSTHIQYLANGKCHMMHSNFNPVLNPENHRRQHMLFAKFAKRQFSKRYYTANNVVIFDRCYVSDMTYGQIGCGSRGTLDQKFKYLNRLFRIITSDKTVAVHFIYCRPEKSAYDPNAKAELLPPDKQSKMQPIYDNLIYDERMQNLFKKYSIDFYVYNFNLDPEYVLFDTTYNK